MALSILRFHGVTYLMEHQALMPLCPQPTALGLWMEGLITATLSTLDGKCESTICIVCRCVYIAVRLLLTLLSYLFYMHSFIHCVKGVFTHQHELASAVPHSCGEITEPSTLTICYASDGSGMVCMVDLIKYSKCTLQSSFCIYPISICSVSDIYVCVLEVKNSPPQLRT